MMNLAYYSALSASLFSIGLAGVVIYTPVNILRTMMCIELMIISICTQFIGFSLQCNHVESQIFILNIIAVAAVESATVLAIFIYFHQKNQ